MTRTSGHSLSRFVELYYEELRQHISQRTGSNTLAEEVIQETWLRAHTSDANIPANPRAYIYRIANNLAIDLIRRESIRKLNNPHISEQTDEIIDQKVSPDPSPEAIAISKQEIAAINQVIEQLPDKCRQAFLLYRSEGLTMREVAMRLTISHKTVEKHIARAMLHCRKYLATAVRNI